VHAPETVRLALAPSTVSRAQLQRNAVMPPRAKAPSAAPAAPAPAGGATPAAVPKPRKPRAPKAPKAAPPEGAPASEKRAGDAAADAQPPAKKRRVRAPRAAKPADEAGSDILNALPDAALSHVLSLLPMDERARLACGCRRLRALVAEIQSAIICFEGALRACRRHFWAMRALSALP
jgi:hypothetical protein